MVEKEKKLVEKGKQRRKISAHGVYIMSIITGFPTVIATKSINLLLRVD